MAFNKELSAMSDTVVITISADLPFAQHAGVVLKVLIKRLCCLITMTMNLGRLMVF